MTTPMTEEESKFQANKVLLAAIMPEDLRICEGITCWKYGPPVTGRDWHYILHVAAERLSEAEREIFVSHVWYATMYATETEYRFNRINASLADRLAAILVAKGLLPLANQKYV